jgi:hypothetical protein
MPDTDNAEVRIRLEVRDSPTNEKSAEEAIGEVRAEPIGHIAK